MENRKPRSDLPVDTRRSEAVDIEFDRPTPPFWGSKILQPDDIPVEELYWNLDLQALIAGQWQFRKPKEQSREDYDAFLAEKVYPVLEQWKHRIAEENLLHPQAIYGYFPCQSQGNSVHIYKPEEAETGTSHRTHCHLGISPAKIPASSLYRRFLCT